MKRKFGFGKLVLTSSLISLFAAGLILTGAFMILKREFPAVEILKTHYPQVIYQGPKKPRIIKILPNPPPGWVRYDAISKHAIYAVIVSEDGSFFSHEGFDPKELKEAIKEDIAERRFARGGSTITMQVVKNAFLSHEKSLYRKFKEFILAIRLDKEVSKKKILETYMNIVEFGEGVWGITQASRLYFQKHPSQLTPKEGAFLAMLLPSPKKYSQSFRAKQLTQFAAKTIDNILFRMMKAGYLAEEDYEIARATPLSWEIASANPPPEQETGEDEDFETHEDFEGDLDPTPVDESS